MKKNKTNLILIFSSIILIACVGFFAYFFSVIKNKNKHTSAVSIELGKKIIEKNNIRELESKMAELQNINNKIGGFFADTSKIDTFVEYLEGLGNDNNVDLLVKNVDPVKNDKNKIIIGLSMSGEFVDILRMLAMLENSQYYIVVNSAYINKDITNKPNEFSADGNGDVIINTNTPKSKEPVVKNNKTKWQANITFSVLSL